MALAGYLSRHNEIKRVDLGGDFWVEVKTHLSHGETKAAKRALMKAHLTMVDDKSETTAEIDMVEYQQAKAFAAIVAWNLTDDNGNQLPLAPDYAKLASIDQMDDDDFDLVMVAIEGVAKKEAKKGGETERKFPR
jgi:aminoglycoside N3'-acetyltransferase